MKNRKKAGASIFHPHDWYQLVRTTGTKNKFEVIEMNQNNFFNFAQVLSNTLVFRKKTETGELFKLQEVRWFQYRTNEIGSVYYKTDLKPESEFKTISFLRRKNRTAIQFEKRYRSPVVISNEKKKDFMDLLHLIPPVFHAFYKNLTTADIPENNPDLQEFEED